MMNGPVLRYNILHGYNVSLHRRILQIPHFPRVVRRYPCTIYIYKNGKREKHSGELS